MRDDTISRQAAIDALGKVDDYGDGIAFEVLSHAQMYISLLPSAERRGRWIYNANFAEPPFKCSACGKSQGRLSNYCPDCGAQMSPPDEE